MSAVEMHTDGFRGALRDLYAGILNNAPQALRAAVRAARDSAKSTKRFKDVTGWLRGSIREDFDGPFKGRLRAGPKYARFVNDGTPPHEISAKGGGVLHFQMQGHDFFRRSVHHPGTKPRPFMDDAAAVGEQTLDYGLELMIERPIAHFNSGE